MKYHYSRIYSLLVASLLHVRSISPSSLGWTEDVIQKLCRGRGQGEQCWHGRTCLCFHQHWHQQHCTIHHRKQYRVSCNNLELKYPRFKIIFRLEKEPSRSEVDNEVSDVSSNELSGPEDGECESDKGKSLFSDWN